MTEWIKCSDKLPQEYDWVLVCRLAIGTGEPTFISIASLRDGKFIFDDFHTGDNTYVGTSYWHDLRDELERSEITHWTYLPPPPNIITDLANNIRKDMANSIIHEFQRRYGI